MKIGAPARKAIKSTICRGLWTTAKLSVYHKGKTGTLALGPMSDDPATALLQAVLSAPILQLEEDV